MHLLVHDDDDAKPDIEIKRLVIRPFPAILTIVGCVIIAYLVKRFRRR